MGPDVKDTLLQVSEDVGSSVLMLVVTVVPSAYHRVAAYTMQSAGEQSCYRGRNKG